MIVQLIKDNLLVILSTIVASGFFLPFLTKWKRINQVGFLVFFALVWLGLNRFNSLTNIQALTKFTAPIPFLALLYWSLRFRTSRRRNPIIYLYFFNAALYLIAVIGADDASIAVVKALFWFLVILCAIKVVDVINTAQDAFLLLLWISSATAVSTLITGSSLIVDPGRTMRAGIDRFFPYGANPNQIGVVFFATTIFSSAILLNSRKAGPRLFFATAIAMSIILSILTASRGVVFSTALGAFSYLVFSIKRITSLILVLVAVSAVLYASVGQIQNTRTSRLSSLHSERFERWETILHRMGYRNWAVGQIGETSFHSEAIAGVDGHSHNAYIKWLYLGGLVTLAPIIVIAFCVIYYGLQNLFKHGMAVAGCAEFWVWYFYVLSLMYGFVNESIFEPTNPLCFLHVFASILILNRRTWVNTLRHRSLPAPTKYEAGLPLSSRHLI